MNVRLGERSFSSPASSVGAIAYVESGRAKGKVVVSPS
jgi:hypothetical protein